MKTIHDSDSNWDELIDKARKNYRFQPILTAKLDNHEGDFTEMTMLEIILWKTNRYPEFTKDILDVINDLRRSFTREKAKALLVHLLTLNGFDLPMASTVLRFACPEELQIIDQRVYRFISNNGETFKKPYKDDQKVKLYFEYIDRLREICYTYNIPFRKADRILYQLDKDLNADFPIKY